MPEGIGEDETELAAVDAALAADVTAVVAEGSPFSEVDPVPSAPVAWGAPVTPVMYEREDRRRAVETRNLSCMSVGKELGRKKTYEIVDIRLFSKR